MSLKDKALENLLDLDGVKYIIQQPQAKNHPRKTTLVMRDVALSVKINLWHPMRFLYERQNQKK